MKKRVMAPSIFVFHPCRLACSPVTGRYLHQHGGNNALSQGSSYARRRKMRLNRRMLRAITLIVLSICLGPASWSPAFAGPCEGDVLAFCQGAVGPKQILECLRQNGPQLSPPCQMQLQELQEAISQTHQDREDIFMLCLGVPPGAPLIQCMRLNRDYISPQCKAGIINLLNSGG